MKCLHSNVGSNPALDMDVCVVCVYSVCVVPCVGRGLAKGLIPVQGVLPTVYRIKKVKKSGQGPTKVCRAIIIIIIIVFSFLDMNVISNIKKNGGTLCSNAECSLLARRPLHAVVT
jgi:hypothetical protein